MTRRPPRSPLFPSTPLFRSTSKHLGAGQGVWPGLPAIVAEELDASWEQMPVESAPAEVPLYGNLAMGGKIQLTGGSTAVANSWQQLRQAGATARAMLVAGAAKASAEPAGGDEERRGVGAVRRVVQQNMLRDISRTD